MNAETIVLRHAEFAARFDVARSVSKPKNHLHDARRVFQLDLYGARMNFISFYNLDVYTLVFVVLSILITVFYVALRFCLHRVRRMRASKHKHE